MPWHRAKAAFEKRPVIIFDGPALGSCVPCAPPPRGSRRGGEPGAASAAWRRWSTRVLGRTSRGRGGDRKKMWFLYKALCVLAARQPPHRCCGDRWSLVFTCQPSHTRGHIYPGTGRRRCPARLHTQRPWEFHASHSRPAPASVSLSASLPFTIPCSISLLL